MVGGAIIVSLALLAMGWATEIVAYFVADEEAQKSVTVALAVACIYVIDFAINAGTSSPAWEAVPSTLTLAAQCKHQVEVSL